MFLVAANTRQALVGQKEWITTGSSGIQVQFLFSDDWDGLSKFAVFRNAEIEESVIPIALPSSNLTELPAENCAAEYVDEKVYVGVYGTDGLGHIIIPTIWVSLGVLKEGAAYEGMDPPQPTPDMWAQILAIAQNAGAENAEAAEKAEAEAKEAASTAQAAAAEVKNLSVDADTLAAGEPATVEKTVDAGTGALKLKFGIPQGPQGEPMTYEDMTEEQKAELVQGPILEAQTSAVAAVGSARTTAVNAVNQAGTTQTGAVNQAGANQVTAVNQAGATQAQAVEDKGAEVIGSIPPDYSDLAAEVDDLNRQLSDETTGLDSKAPVILETASGAIASFDDGADSMPIRKIVATIEPVQAAGTPSPENPLPISGWTGAILGNTVPAPESGITFPFEPKQAGAGDPSPTNIRPISGYDLTLEDETHVTVYCGAVTLNQDGSADVVSELGARVLNGSETWSPNTSYPGNAFFTSAHGMKRATNYKKVILCDKVKVCAGFTFQDFYDATEGITGFHRSDYSGKNWLYIRVNGVTTATGIKEWLANNPLQVCYQLATPKIYHFSNVGQLKTFLGEIGYTAQLLPVNWQTEAGTVYVGTLTLNADGSVDLVSKWIGSKMSDLTWSYNSTRACFESEWLNRAVHVAGYLSNRCSMYKAVENSAYPTVDLTVNLNSTTAAERSYFRLIDRSCNGDVSAFVSKITDADGFIAWQLQTAAYRTYHFDNVGHLKTFLGVNNVWCDTGDITELTYPADTKLFLTARDEEITGNIAPIENGATASKAYAQGAYFWHDTKFCKALTAIASGATFTLGTNYQETTVAAELLAAQN